jgi:FkbM family methyltransferase
MVIVSPVHKISFFLARFFSQLGGKLPLESVVIPFGRYRFIVPRRWLEASLLNIEHIYVLGDYERVPCLTCVKPGGAVLDLGAFVGLFSVRVAGENRDVRVYGVEANPFACRYLEANYRLNGVRSGGVLCGAVGVRSGVARLFVADNGVNSSLVPGYVDDYSVKIGEVGVRVYSLREVFERFQLDRVALVKMDIEGAEEGVLYSSRELVSPDRVERWIIEVHPPYSSPSRIVGLLEKGYRVATFYDYNAPGQVFVYAWTRR